MKLPIQYRAATIVSGTIDKDARTVDLSFSSETPVKRGFGNEILGHNPGEIRMDRLKDSAPLLHNHDPDQHVGVVQAAQIKGGKGLATVRFAKDADSDKHFQQIQDGIKPNVSVGYKIHAVKLVSTNSDDGDTYRVTDWEPHEISTVSMPLDYTVGVGRGNIDEELFEVRIVDNPELEKRTAQEFMAETTVTETKATEIQTKTVEPKVEITREQIASEERARSKEIRTIARQFTGYGETFTNEAETYIDGGRSVQEFNNWCVRELAKTAGLTSRGGSASQVSEIRMTGKDPMSYSVVKALRESYECQLKGSRSSLSGIELEINQEIQTKIPTRSPNGFWLPTFGLDNKFQRNGQDSNGLRLLKRDLSTLTQGAGAFTVESSVLGTELVALLRPRMYTMAAGARYLGGLQGNILIPRHIGAGTAYWLAENASVTEADQTFGQFQLSPHTLMAQTKYSKQLLAQSSIDVEGLVRSDLNYILAIALDLAAMIGTGINGQPIGIYNVGAVTTQSAHSGLAAVDQTPGTLPTVNVVTFGASATWGDVVLFESLVASLNADVDGMAYITSPLTRGKWKTTSKVTNFPTFLWESGGVKWDDGGKGTDAGLVNGYRAFATNQLSSIAINAGTAAGTIANGVILGNFNDLLIANWAGIDVVTDPYTAANTGEIVVTIHLMCDIGIRRPRSFCISTDSGAQ